MFLKNKKAQSLVEYAVILIIVMGAFLTIGNYMKRGIQGRWKAATDDLGDQYDPRAACSLVQYQQFVNTSTRIQSVNSELGTFTYRTDESTTAETKNGFISIGSY